MIDSSEVFIFMGNPKKDKYIEVMYKRATQKAPTLDRAMRGLQSAVGDSVAAGNLDRNDLLNVQWYVDLEIKSEYYVRTPKNNE